MPQTNQNFNVLTQCQYFFDFNTNKPKLETNTMRISYIDFMKSKETKKFKEIRRIEEKRKSVEANNAPSILGSQWHKTDDVSKYYHNKMVSSDRFKESNSSLVQNKGNKMSVLMSNHKTMLNSQSDEHL